MAIHHTFTDSMTGASITLIELPIPSRFTFSAPPHLITNSMALVRNDKAADASPTSRPQEKSLLDFIIHMMLIAYGDAVTRFSTDDSWEVPSDSDSYSTASEEQTVPTPTLDELADQLIHTLPLPAHGPPAAFNKSETVINAVTWVVRAALWLATCAVEENDYDGFADRKLQIAVERSAEHTLAEFESLLKGTLLGNSAACNPVSISDDDILEALADDMSSTSSKDFMSMVQENFTPIIVEEYFVSTNITSTVTEDCVEMTPRIMVDVGMARTADATASPLAKKQEKAVLDKMFKQSRLRDVKLWSMPQQYRSGDEIKPKKKTKATKPGSEKAQKLPKIEVKQAKKDDKTRLLHLDADA